MTGVSTAPALASALVEEYPDIVRASRFNGTGTVALNHEDKLFYETGHAVDPDFLEMFSFKLTEGDFRAALSEPHSIVLTEDLAQKYFPEENPLGKTVTVDGRYPYTVTGVAQNVPRNSTIQFNFLIPFMALEELWNDPGYPSSWTNWNTRMYVQLRKGAFHKEVSSKIADRLHKSNVDANVVLFLQPYTRLHLHGLGVVGGGIVLVILFTIIALFILAIACMNFMNLATARSARRGREIGMRKVAGATRGDIIIQFYGESLVMSFASLIVAVALVELLLPIFNGLVGKELTADFVSNPILGFGLIGVTVLTGIVAGSYPALYMSLFQPAKIVKGGLGPDSRSSRFRKTLVVLQFTLSVILIAAASIIFKQVDFMRSVDLGFDKEHLVYFHIKEGIRDHCEAAKLKLLQDPGILHVSPTSRSPLGVYTNGSGWEWEGRNPEVDPLITYFFSDVDFIETFHVDMALGQFYLKDHAGGSSSHFGEVVINETLARMLGINDAVGARLSNYGYDYTVIGVIKDFNFKPLHREIEPMILFHKTNKHLTLPNRYNYMFVRIRPDDVPRTLAHIEDVYKEFNPDFPFTYYFFDEAHDRLHARSQRAGLIIRYAAALAIMISCLGLFGLAAYSTEQRTKEIGIRKVLGASTSGIVGLLSREFLMQIIIANIIGGVIVYIFMTSWLRDFAYRTSIGWQPFVLACILTICVAFLSVSFHAIRAACANPVEALRHE
jgi:ABC-type antimicrobial peptide transport system permease subunit